MRVYIIGPVVVPVANSAALSLVLFCVCIVGSSSPSLDSNVALPWRVFPQVNEQCSYTNTNSYHSGYYCLSLDC